MEEVNLIFSGALVDNYAGAHHPETAAEALLKMQQIRYRDERERLARASDGMQHDWQAEWITSPAVDKSSRPIEDEEKTPSGT